MITFPLFFNKNKTDDEVIVLQLVSVFKTAERKIKVNKLLVCHLTRMHHHSERPES